MRQFVIRNMDSGVIDILVTTPGGTFVIPNRWEIVDQVPELSDLVKAAADNMTENSSGQMQK